MRFNWTDEIEAHLVRLVYGEGLSHQAAAEQISPRLTKNAINKKLMRMRDTGRLAEIQRGLGADGMRDDWRDHNVSEQSAGENHKEVSSKSTRIKTLDQLLEAAEVDQEIWFVDHYVINKWEVGAKLDKKHLTFTRGVIDGTITSEGLVVEPLWQVKAWLRRREPIPVFPTIQPILCNETFPAPKPEPVAGVGRSLVIADLQFGFSRNVRTGELTPFHDNSVLDIFVQIAELSGVDRIDILGDTLDLPEWSDRFLRSPEFTETTQPAINAGHAFLKTLRQVSDAEITVFEGNHDKRMISAIVSHLKAAYELRAASELELPPALSVPKLLALHELNIKWIGDYPKGHKWLNQRVYLSHGNIARVPGKTAAAVAANTNVVEIFGHSHRMELMARTQHLVSGPRQVWAFSVGCGCRIDGTVPSKGRNEQWQNGCAIVSYEVGGSAFDIDPIAIENKMAVWNGMIIRARR